MKKIAAGGLAADFVIFAASWFITAPHLVVSRDGERILSFPAAENKEFSIEFIHSVNKSPVTEFFEIRNGAITLTAAEFTDFGAGMPVYAQENQTMFRTPEGSIRIENFNRTITELNYIVGYTYHVLHVNNQHFALNDPGRPGTHIKITVQELNIWRAGQ
jgi:hypothetical protein